MNPIISFSNDLKSLVFIEPKIIHQSNTFLKLNIAYQLKRIIWKYELDSNFII